MKSSLVYRILFATLFCLSLYGLAHSGGKEWKQLRKTKVVFYNVENLFDTLDTPDKKDEEYLPDSERQWNSERYNDKLNRIVEVINSMSDDGYPSIIGLCEVENISPLNDLCAHQELKKAKYTPILIEGPDQRGIDVAMIYSKKQFKVLSTKSYNVDLGGDFRPTRDILYVKGQFRRGPIVHFLVNHWPSRYGGAEKSEPKRITAAKALASVTDSIHRSEEDALIICMGDFNDYPDNRSLTEYLPTSEDGYLVNLMDGLSDTKRGSYNYRGDWGFLDQIIVSKNLRDDQAPFVLPMSTSPFYTDSMVYIHPKYGDEKPKRTYGGKEYLGGYSDHLPVTTILTY